MNSCLKIHHFELYYVAFSVFIRLIFLFKHFYLSPHFINGLEVANRKNVIYLGKIIFLINSELASRGLERKKNKFLGNAIKIYNFSDLINAEIDK